MTELIRLFSALDTFILRVSINLCLYDDVFPLPFAACFNHALKIGTHIVCAGHCAVNVCIDDEKLVVLCIVLTDTELSFDRLFCLCVTPQTNPSRYS